MPAYFNYALRKGTSGNFGRDAFRLLADHKYYVPEFSDGRQQGAFHHDLAICTLNLDAGSGRRPHGGLACASALASLIGFPAIAASALSRDRLGRYGFRQMRVRRRQP